jgi:kynurenine formamidase
MPGRQHPVATNHDRGKNCGETISALLDKSRPPSLSWFNSARASALIPQTVAPVTAHTAWVGPTWAVLATRNTHRGGGPGIVIDIGAKVRRNVDYQLTVADLKRWRARYGRMPKGAAVLAWTGCDRWWSAKQTGRNYYNCGTGQAGLHQPGFSLAAVRWLIDHHILGRQGALGIDTFGPDPGTDEEFRESSLVLHRHRLTLENLTGLGQLPPRGAWVVVGGPRNHNGSGSPATIFGLVP